MPPESGFTDKLAVILFKCLWVKDCFNCFLASAVHDWVLPCGCVLEISASSEQQVHNGSQ